MSAVVHAIGVDAVRPDQSAVAFDPPDRLAGWIELVDRPSLARQFGGHYQQTEPGGVRSGHDRGRHRQRHGRQERTWTPPRGSPGDGFGCLGRNKLAGRIQRLALGDGDVLHEGDGLGPAGAQGDSEAPGVEREGTAAPTQSGPHGCGICGGNEAAQRREVVTPGDGESLWSEWR